MPTRVLVVDDSLVMRSLITAALSKDPDIEIVGHAADALEAREAIKSTNPDVITLDIEMPKMDGLSFLRQIMRLRPTPVVMVSNLTQRGADSTVRALELGAVDCICKPGIDHPDSFAALPRIIKTARGATLRPLSDKPVQQKAESVASDYTPDGKLVAIGASTGGVDALMSVISAMPANCPPTVIAQHMPGLFTKSFAQRLNRACAAEVSEAVDGAPIKPGRIYLAPGDKAHLVVGGGKGAWTCRFTTDPPVNGHRPSVDTLFASVARAAGASAVGVILTGMGRDGANGLLEMRKAGAATIGQDEQSSLIYGMPRAAFEIGAVQKQAPLTSIGRLILSATQGRPR